MTNLEIIKAAAYDIEASLRCIIANASLAQPISEWNMKNIYFLSLNDIHKKTDVILKTIKKEYCEGIDDIDSEKSDV